MFSFNSLRLFDFLQQNHLFEGDKGEENFGTAADYEEPWPMYAVLEKMQAIGLLNEEHQQRNFELITGFKGPNRYITNYLSTLSGMDELGLFTQDVKQLNFEISMNYKGSARLESTLKMAKRVGLLDAPLEQSNFEIIAGHEESRSLEEILKVAERIGLLNEPFRQSNFEIIARRALGWFERALVIAGRIGLLDAPLKQSNFEIIAGHKEIYRLGDALEITERVGLLDDPLKQSNFEIIAGHEEIYWLDDALKKAEPVGLLDDPLKQSNFEIIAGHEEPNRLSSALGLASELGLFSKEDRQKNFNSIVCHKEIASIESALHDAVIELASYDVMATNKDFFHCILNHEKPQLMLEVLIKALKANILTQKNFNAILQHPNRFEMGFAIELIDAAGLLSGKEKQENFDCILKSSKAQHAAQLLVQADRLGLLNNNDKHLNREIIEKHHHPRGGAYLLSMAQVMGLLLTDDMTQTFFNQVDQYSNILFGDEEGLGVWDDFPADLLETHWRGILQLCRANQVNVTAGRVALSRRLNQLIYRTTTQKPAFNAGQSTHTASVHQSVSESAIRLNKLYGDKIDNLQKTLEQIEAWVNSQDGHDVEKRAIQQLVHSSYEFIDQTSGINTKTLLALSWMAIHDESMFFKALPITESTEALIEILVKMRIKEPSEFKEKLGEVKETLKGLEGEEEKRAVESLFIKELTKRAETLFLEGLFEIQRAYNLSDRFEDDKDERDKASCASGTFNKFIEKLVGVHPAAKLKYLTNQGAMFKLTPLIIAASKQHLKQNDFQDLTLASLKKAIYSIVREQLFFEYADGPIEALAKNHDTFEAFKASENYPMFQALLTKAQNEGLELMIEGKLLVDGTDAELDEKLNALITLATKKEDKAAAEESELSLTKEEMRDIRLRMFDKKNNDALDSKENKAPPVPGV
ncbi:MAG: hypothetical protein QNK11_07285 [Legionella sp.]|nr:hypothetical protein [Legionella sp.]